MTENNISIVKGSIYIKDRKPTKIIRSNNSLTKEGKIFGDLLFGELEELYGKEYEKDMPKEKKLFDDLMDFIRGDYIDLPKSTALISTLKKLMKLKDVYPKVLKKLDSELLYRGNKKIDDDTLNAFKKDSKYPIEQQGNYKFIIVPYIYKPHSPVQSWTSNFQVAQMFGIKSIIRAKIPAKELVFNELFLNILSNFSAVGDEDEVIRVGNNIKCELMVLVDLTEDIPLDWYT